MADTPPHSCQSCDEDSPLTEPGLNVRDALIRKYSYKQAMSLGSFSNTVGETQAVQADKLHFAKDL